mmetsp:Transcript_43740/g.138244  ORF Transcript_43740/g.138244 Transcript_43740/m.138244 type:complete len:711 (+) Transcript_43740:356-2488(+)
MLQQLKATFKEALKEGVKEAGRQVRATVERQRDLQPSRSEDIPTCDESNGKLREKFAELELTIIEGRDLPASTWENAGTLGLLDSYCVVKVEGARRSTAVSKRQVNPEWNVRMKFSITDLSTDIVIQVYSISSSGAFENTKLIGQCILPLAHILPSLMPEHVQVASVHGVPTVRRAEQADCTDQEAWMELFPLSKTSSKFEVIPKELSNDVDGMLRPRYPLGKIKVRTKLQLLRSMRDIYLNAAIPINPISIGRKQKASDDDGLPNLKQLKWNCLRIKTAVARPPSWWKLIVLMRSWERPLLSILWILLLVGVALKAELWQVPLISSSLVCCLSIFSRTARRLEREKSVPTWHEPGHARRNVVEKAREAKATLLRLQRETGRAASNIEKLRNAFNWSDENASWFICCTVSICGASMSLLLYSLSLFFQVVPPRLILAFGMILMNLPPPLREMFALRTLQRNQMLRSFIMDVRAACGFCCPSKDLLQEENEDDALSYVDIFAERQAEEATAFGPLGEAFHSLRKLWKHVPNEMDMVHRTICKRQVGETSRRPCRPLLADCETPEAEGPSAAKGPLKLRSAEAPSSADEERLQSEVQRELDEMGYPAAEEEEDEAARLMKLRPQELIDEIRKLGKEPKGLVEKQELVAELIGLRSSLRGDTRNEEQKSADVDWSEKLNLLVEMGFTDLIENEELLHRHGGDVKKVIEAILKR